MGKDWINENGDVVHPNAPQGAGGPGSFRNPNPLGWGGDLHSSVPHPHSPAARHVALNDEHKKHLKQRHSAPHPAAHHPAPHPATPPVDDPALNAKVKKAADDLVHQRVVGSGECYDLADKVLTDSKAKSAPDYGKITKTANYDWGSPIDLGAVKAGDVLQFRDHKITITTVKNVKTTQPDGSWTTATKKTTETHIRPHHTAVVSSVDGDGVLTVIEQHVKDPATGELSKVVRENKLFLHSVKPKVSRVSKKVGNVSVEDETTVTLSVSGKIWAYRPQPK
jgi:hypothetical protein